MLELAGETYFERGEGYHRGGHVHDLVEHAGVVVAKVVGTEDYRVRLWSEDGLDFACDCPLGVDGEFCKHCVAAGLAWLDGDFSEHDIPVCPFSQRLEILLALKGLEDRVGFHVVDIAKPRPDWLLEKTRGTTALPALETEDGRILKESIVILRYLEDLFPEPAVAQRDPYLRVAEGMMCAMEGAFAAHGYRYVMNQDANRREEFREGMLDQYSRLNDFLTQHNPEGTYLFEDFGWAETVFTPLFVRFWFLEYYEDFDLPETNEYARVRRWRDACLAHPAAKQVTNLRKRASHTIPFPRTMWGVVPETLADGLSGMELLPEKISVDSDLLFALLEPLAEETGFELELAPSLPSLEAVREDLLETFGG